MGYGSAAARTKQELCGGSPGYPQKSARFCHHVIDYAVDAAMGDLARATATSSFDWRRRPRSGVGNGVQAADRR
jgi:hypothetical protein